MQMSMSDDGANIMLKSLRATKARRVTASSQHRPVSRFPKALFRGNVDEVGAGDEFVRFDTNHKLEEYEDDDDDDDDPEYSDEDIPELQSKMVVRDQHGRYLPIGQGSSSSTVAKRRKKSGGGDESWRLFGPVDDGPTVVTLLRSFAGHVAYKSWSKPNNLRPWLTCYERPSCLKDVPLRDEVAEMVGGSGLESLRRCMPTGLDENLISAFIERWHPDTNTFHMPFGEITILLHDVERILGIRVDGMRVMDEDSAGEEAGLKKKLSRFYGVSLDKVGIPFYKGGGLTMKSLRDIVVGGTRHDAFRAYMMLLLGQTLFMDKSDDKVMARMFPLFVDLDRFPTYAWGAATLAYLYRQLGTASRKGAKCIGGCLPLLQAWIYEYFPQFRPHGGYYVQGKPLVEAWSQVPQFKGSHEMLGAHRQSLDGLRGEHIRWTPYGPNPHRDCRRTLYSGFVRFLEIVEPYQPGRCLRQFGYVQTIPLPPPSPNDEHRPADPREGYMVSFGRNPDAYWDIPDAHLVLSELSQRVVMPWDTAKRYMVWYQKNSHMYFYPPALRTRFRVLPINEEPEVCRAVGR